MKVIAFPFAGGNKYSFNYLKRHLNIASIELITIEYPGRGQRINEPLIDDVNDLVELMFNDLVNSIKSHDEYIIYGHSMGGLIGYLICKKIEEKSFKKPLKLIVSGKKAPSKKRKEKIHGLDRNLFWDNVSKLGGIPEELLKEDSLKAFFEPVLRADFKIVEDFQYSDAANLSISIDVIYGDEEINEDNDFNLWSRETLNKVRFSERKGNHFFIYDDEIYLSNKIIKSFAK